MHLKVTDLACVGGSAFDALASCVVAALGGFEATCVLVCVDANRPQAGVKNPRTMTAKGDAARFMGSTVFMKPRDRPSFAYARVRRRIYNCARWVRSRTGRRASNKHSYSRSSLRLATARSWQSSSPCRITDPPQNLFLNPGAEQLLGYSVAKFQSMSAWDWLAPEELPRVQALRERYLRGARGCRNPSKRRC